MYSQIQKNKNKSYLLIIIFMIVTSAIGYGLSVAVGNYAIFIFSVIYAVGYSFFGYFFSAKMALKSSGAITVELEEAPELHNMVENLAITAGIPKPTVHLIKSDGLNAFATGRNPENAAIAVTTGLLDKLTKPELEGVLAHELSHVKNYDIRVMALVITFVSVIGFISNYGVRMGMFSSGDNENRGGAGINIMIALLIAIITPLIAKIIQLAVSRKREYLADASGALLTRYPEGLASALEKISEKPEIEKASNLNAHLFISSPLKMKSFSKLFSTHPPIDERVKILRDMKNEA